MRARAHVCVLSYCCAGKVSEASVAVLISHSGRTAETLTACEHLQARGVTVLAIVSDKGEFFSLMYKSSDPSVAFLSTRSLASCCQYFASWSHCYW